MRSGDVVGFIESIKELGILLKYCEEFHKRDRRDVDYVVSRSIVMRDPNNINFVLAGARIIIITWNGVGFQRLSSDTRANLEKDIIDVYEESREKLRMLEGKGWKFKP